MSSSSAQDINQDLEPTSVTYPTPKVLGLVLLDVLPVELVLLVAFFLPREDIYSLSLCNHRLLKIFQSQTKHKLKAEALLPFLRRLEHDNPRYLACDDCLVLHHFDRIPEPLRIPDPLVQISPYYPPLLGCVQTARFWPVPIAHNYVRMPIHDGRSTHCGYRLHWSHLHLAMRGFHHGPEYGISTDALAFTGVSHELIAGNDSGLVLSSVEARICPKPAGLGLYMRFQDMIVAKMTWLGSHHEGFKFCSHQSMSFWLEDMYGNETYQPEFYSNCEECNTDYEIGWLRNEELRNITVVVTRWVSLGPGLTPDDPRWRINAYCETWGQPQGLKLESEERGPSPRWTFEGLTDTSVDTLTSHNLSYIEEDRYQAEMVRVSDVPSWGLWKGAPW